MRFLCWDKPISVEAETVKSFQTAVNAEVAAQAGEIETYPFEVDGVQCIAYKPDESQLAMAISSMGRFSKDTDQIAGVINFFVGILDERSNTYLVNRLLDRNDAFGLKQVTSIIEWLIEEWSGRPTKSSSDSTGSPPSTGSASVLPIPVST